MRTAQFSEIETGSGRLVDVLFPDVADVSIWDVVNSLSGTCRFTGHIRPFYSNAQHSCVVASYLGEEDRIHGLLHDAAEAIIGDLSSPVKAALAHICPDFKRAWKYIERMAEAAIYEAAGMSLPSDRVRECVKRADLIALATEQRDVMRSPNAWNLPVAPAERKIVPVSSREAALMFADALAECGVKVDYPHGPFGEAQTFAPLAESAATSKSAKPDPEYVRSILAYDPETGVLTWKHRPAMAPWWNTRFAGKPAGSKTQGYINVSVDHKGFGAHVLAWVIVTGEWPEGEIDHEDTNGENNCWRNLRQASHAENLRNMSLRADKPLKGISWVPHCQKWKAQIRAGGKNLYLGLFADPESAAAAYREAPAFHHGEFGRSDLGSNAGAAA